MLIRKQKFEPLKQLVGSSLIIRNILFYDKNIDKERKGKHTQRITTKHSSVSMINSILFSYRETHKLK